MKFVTTLLLAATSSGMAASSPTSLVYANIQKCRLSTY
jgi:hypothetical protein